MTKNRAATEELIDLETAVDAIDRLTWDETDRDDQVGLEIEAFPMAAGPRFGSRLPLVEVMETVAGGLRSPNLSAPQNPPVFATQEGGRVSFEPGGQIELSTSARPDIPSLMNEVEESWGSLEAMFRDRQADLVCLGLDPWHDTADVAQQHTSGRYIAMDRYFARRWPAGAVMMRNTCSLQVNVESGTGTTREERWMAANLMSPILTAMFSTSPGPRGVSNRRAGVWQAIDPTRTGYPYWSGLDRCDPLDDARRRALEANVVFVVRDGEVTLTEPGLSFEKWVRRGHAELGRPTTHDLRTHLSTLFTEVRPRNGILEMRAVDALMRRWWVAPAAVITGILYDEQARDQAINLMLPFAGQLDLTWRISADAGLKAAELGGTAAKLAFLALEAAGRSRHFDRSAVAVTEEFVERFTLRGLSPADELRPLFFGDSAAIRSRVSSVRAPARDPR